MNIAYDIFAETNPAFCAAVLVEFTKSYMSIDPQGPETPLAYLALPIALSGDLASAFEGTNKATGLLEWLERTPSAQVGLTERVNASLDIVSEAVRYGCFTRVLSIGEGGRLCLGERRLKERALSRLGEEPRSAISRAKRLGFWFITAGSTRTVFDAMGLTV
ncbi:three component ABC system middle component [Achromobacter deleyi]|uniref:three component ABC system middle component n=1 Tax=Achromobacter deleyi TaxID=1353891 RepID=UPI0014682FA7|nr:three component ABC system middle component [Achromobacter deleyi]CAB3837505.1 hypothetical protein LMG3412_01072 [Achromobacter deleyi]